MFSTFSFNIISIKTAESKGFPQLFLCIRHTVPQPAIRTLPCSAVQAYVKWHNGKRHVHRFSVFGTCNAERIYACLSNSAVISQLPPAYSCIIGMIDRFDIADEGRMAAVTARQIHVFEPQILFPDQCPFPASFDKMGLVPYLRRMQGVVPIISVVRNNTSFFVDKARHLPVLIRSHDTDVDGKCG